MSFSGYPASLRFVFSKLTGFTRNRVRMPVLTPTQANANDLIIIELGANQKVDLSTLAILFTLDTSATGGTTPSVMPPRHTNCLIQQLSVDINGLNVFNLDQYNHLHFLMMSYLGGDRSQQFATVSGELGNNYTTQANSCTLTNVPLCFKNFLGILGSCKILDLGILGPLRITIRLAPNSCLTLNGSPTNSSYSLKNMSVQYDVVTIQDGIYDQMVSTRLLNDTIPIVYNNYLSFLGPSSTTPDQCTNRVPCNVSSLDFVHHTLLPSDYNTNQTLRNGTSGYFYKGDSNNQLYGCQAQIGSTFIPNFRQNYPLEMLLQTSDSIGLGQDLLGSTDPNFRNATISGATSSNTLTNIYTGGFFMHSTRLCHGTDAGDFASKTISGLDCRGANVMVGVTTFANSGGAPVFPLTYLQFSSQLLVGSNRQLQLIM